MIAATHKMLIKYLCGIVRVIIVPWLLRNSIATSPKSAKPFVAV